MNRRRDGLEALQDAELEKRIMRDVLQHGMGARYAECTLSTAAWSHPVYAVIWQVAAALDADGQSVDPVTVSTRAQHPDLSLAHLTRLAAGHDPRLDASAIEAAAAKLTRLAEARRVVSTLDSIRQQVVTHPEAAAEAVAHLTATLDNMPTETAPDWLDDVAIRQHSGEAAMLVEPYLPVVGLGALIGPPEIGKSFKALDWALTVALQTGRPVLYFSPEGRGHYAARVEAWKVAHGVPVDQVLGVHFVTDSPPLDDPATVARLVPHVRRLRPALTVVDTLNRHFGGDSENDSACMGRFVRGVETLARAADGFALVTHHTNAGGLVERGSTALRGACDVMYTLTRANEDDDALTLACSKRKDGPRLPAVTYQIRAVEPSAVIEPAVLSVGAVDLSPAETAILRALVVTFRHTGATNSELREVVKLSNGSFYRGRAGLVDRGFVELRGQRYLITIAGRIAAVGICPATGVPIPAHSHEIPTRAGVA